MIPLCMRFAIKFGIMDVPGGRKIHKKSIPLLGGIAIGLSFISVIVLLDIFSFININAPMFGILIGSLIILIIGLCDDIKGINVFFKLSGQLMAAIIVTIFGLFLYSKSSITTNITYIKFLVSILWIIYIMNAINLLDGLDGLAAGCILILSIFTAIIAVYKNNLITAYLSVIITALCSAFLIFNFPPAKIFMGDAGSMFTGLIISSFIITGNNENLFTNNLIILSILLALPILDMFIVVSKRILNRKNIFKADRNHIHHKLIDRGFNVKKVVLIEYSICILLGILSLIIAVIL